LIAWPVSSANPTGDRYDQQPITTIFRSETVRFFACSAVRRGKALREKCPREAHRGAALTMAPDLSSTPTSGMRGQPVPFQPTDKSELKRVADPTPNPLALASAR
jgi:hypothetical protein